MVRPVTSSHQLWLEQSINTAGYLGAIGYGLHIAVHFAATHYLLTSRNPLRWKLHAFNTAIFAMGTIHIATTIRFAQQAWILERGYEGGPYAFLLHEESRPIVLLGLSAASIAGFLIDGLLSAHPYIGTWGPNLGIACWATSMTLNMLLTTLLAAKILYHRRQLLASGLVDASSAYLGAASMLIETAFPVALISCIFIILYARQNTAENLFIPLIAQVYCIAPQLIIIQVYRGRAWSGATTTQAQESLTNPSTPSEPKPASPGEISTIHFARRQSTTHQPKLELLHISTATEDSGSMNALERHHLEGSEVSERNDEDLIRLRHKWRSSHDLLSATPTMSLLKVPFLLSVMYCTYTTMTPPTHTPPKSEKLPPTGWELIVPWFPYIPKAIFVGLSICEAAAIVASAFPGGAAARTTDLLTLLTFSTPATALHLRLTPVFLCGWALNLAGTLLRIACYRALGSQFTFELSIRAGHQLVTSGPYALVRHPSYTGALISCAGMLTAHLSRGSWAMECLGLHGLGVRRRWICIGLASFFALALVPRMNKEDRMLKKRFGERWERWRMAVPFRLVPWVY
ncbi:hypothetical protein EYR40_007337 [Pleurotus pulmonarius]|nr:hypothetical protein EYR40_007337 [Pleurotus pulmonarius]